MAAARHSGNDREAHASAPSGRSRQREASFSRSICHLPRRLMFALIADAQAVQNARLVAAAIRHDVA